MEAPWLTVDLTRRHLLGTLGGLSAAALAGCVQDDDGDPQASDPPATPPSTPAGEAPTPQAQPPPPDIEGVPPLADEPLFLTWDPATYVAHAVDSPAPKDGIPSIDDPRFAPADEVDIDDDDPIFGVARNGTVRAYPQSILVYHEIVNDTIGGENVAITYCPLTGTAQGFLRGDVEFGVAGHLVNSNMIMFDRTTDSWWPQILATGIDGPFVGQHLREFRVVWTTWGRWRDAHPDTVVLTEETGYVRRYGVDPYGSYNPPLGYYISGETMYPPIQNGDVEHPKEVVIGTRTATGAICFNKETLLEERILTGDLHGDQFVAVADPALATGFIYQNPTEVSVTVAGGRYRIDDETFPADELPLERTLAFDAMWFAWFGFYLETEYVS